MKNILIIATTRAELPPTEGAIIEKYGILVNKRLLNENIKKAIVRQNEYLCKLTRFIFA